MPKYFVNHFPKFARLTPSVLSRATQQFSPLSQQTPLPFVSLAQQPPSPSSPSHITPPRRLPCQKPPSPSSPSHRKPPAVISLAQQPLPPPLSASTTLEISACFNLSDVLVRQETVWLMIVMICGFWFVCFGLFLVLIEWVLLWLWFLVGLWVFLWWFAVVGLHFAVGFWFFFFFLNFAGNCCVSGDYSRL